MTDYLVCLAGDRDNAVTIQEVSVQDAVELFCYQNSYEINGEGTLGCQETIEAKLPNDDVWQKFDVLLSVFYHYNVFEIKDD